MFRLPQENNCETKTPEPYSKSMLFLAMRIDWVQSCLVLLLLWFMSTLSYNPCHEKQMWQNRNYGVQWWGSNETVKRQQRPRTWNTREQVEALIPRFIYTFHHPILKLEGKRTRNGPDEKPRITPNTSLQTPPHIATWHDEGGLRGIVWGRIPHGGNKWFQY